MSSLRRSSRKKSDFSARALVGPRKYKKRKSAHDDGGGNGTSDEQASIDRGDVRLFDKGGGQLVEEHKLATLMESEDLLLEDRKVLVSEEMTVSSTVTVSEEVDVIVSEEVTLPSTVIKLSKGVIDVVPEKEQKDYLSNNSTSEVDKYLPVSVKVVPVNEQKSSPKNSILKEDNAVLLSEEGIEVSPAVEEYTPIKDSVVEGAQGASMPAEVLPVKKLEQVSIKDGSASSRSREAQNQAESISENKMQAVIETLDNHSWDQVKGQMVIIEGQGDGEKSIVLKIKTDEEVELKSDESEATEVEEEYTIVTEDPDANVEVVFCPLTEKDIDLDPVTGKPARAPVPAATASLKKLLEKMNPDVDLSDHVNFLKGNNRGMMQCKHCFALIGNRHEFRQHMRSKHADLQYKPFKCPLCDYRGELRACVARHINVHSDHKPYKCSICEKGFIYKQKLQMHMKHHQASLFKCTQCPLTFHAQEAYLKHLEVHYEGVVKDLSEVRTVLNKNLQSIQPAKEVNRSLEEGEIESKISQPKGTVIGKKRPMTSYHMDYCKDHEAGAEVKNIRNVFTCMLCEHAATTRSLFFQHIEQSHPEIKGWQCPHCPYRSRSRPSMLTHIKIHTGEKIHTCPECNKSFLHKHKLTSHMRVHVNPRNVQCPKCPKAFNETNDLTKHIRRVHIGLRLFECECGKKFKDNAQLRAHKATHNSLKSEKCTVCHKMYKSQASLKQHMKAHQCMYHCEICDRGFGSYSGFMAHKVMHDESYEGFDCPQCDAVLHTKGSLNRHIKVVHSNERAFACLVCDSTYKTRKDLNKHPQNHCVTHVKGEDLRCPTCDFPCKRPDSLRVHMLKHLEQKPFWCGLCGKQYTQKHGLHMHIARHNKSNKCIYCDISIPNGRLMYAHLRSFHPEELERDSVHTPIQPAPATKSVTTKKPVAESSQEDPLNCDVLTVYMCEFCDEVLLNDQALNAHLEEVHQVISEDHLNPPTTESQISISTGSSERLVTLIHPVDAKESSVITVDSSGAQYSEQAPSASFFSTDMEEDMSGVKLEDSNIVVFEDVAGNTEIVNTTEDDDALHIDESTMQKGEGSED